MAYLENAWYCASFSEEVTAVPMTRRLLDRPVLLSRDEAGQVHAIGNMCPHRFAPLHKGKRVDGAIECPYHGLRFDLVTGACVHNPHGSGRIPGSARVAAYPVVEAQGVVWFWPGDPALADPEAVVDLKLIPREGPAISGYLNMPVDYRLVIDNLLDLSHATYIHPGTLAPVDGKRESRFEVDDRSVHSFYVMRNVTTPLSQAATFPGERGDYYSEMQWIAPGTLRQGLAMSETGAPPDTGANMRGVHLITPESASSTHYFWLTSRNRRVDDAELDERTRALVNKAFMTEDEPMIADCQDNMAGREFFSLQPLYLETDYAGARCRRILEGLIAAEHQAPAVGAPEGQAADRRRSQAAAQNQGVDA